MTASQLGPAPPTCGLKTLHVDLATESGITLHQLNIRRSNNRLKIYTEFNLNKSNILVRVTYKYMDMQHWEPRQGPQGGRRAKCDS